MVHQHGDNHKIPNEHKRHKYVISSLLPTDISSVPTTVPTAFHLDC